MLDNSKETMTKDTLKKQQKRELSSSEIKNKGTTINKTNQRETTGASR